MSILTDDARQRLATLSPRETLEFWAAKTTLKKLCRSYP